MTRCTCESNWISTIPNNLAQTPANTYLAWAVGTTYASGTTYAAGAVVFVAWIALAIGAANVALMRRDA